jgi:hypothetical protein
MKRAAILVVVLLACSSAASAGQTRRGSAQSRLAAATKAATDRRAAAERIAGYITTISNFLFVYGSVVKGIQTSEEKASRRPLPAESQAILDKSKSGVAESIRNLQDNMRRMEMDFAENPDLKDYYIHVNRLSEDVGHAADAAEAGKYDDAGKRLVSVVTALANALLPAQP